MRAQGWALTNEIRALTRKDTKGISVRHGGYSKTAICKLGKGPSMRHQICQHLDPGLPASRTVRNTGLLPGLWCLLPHPSWLTATSTPLSRWSLWPFSLSFLTHHASYLCLYNQHSTSGAEGPREWQGWRRHSEPVANEPGPDGTELLCSIRWVKIARCDVTSRPQRKGGRHREDTDVGQHLPAGTMPDALPAIPA